MTELVRYDAMCNAIAECHRVDEVKDIRDKAMAMEVYARIAMNVDAERKATEIRLRAERRTGEPLKELDRGGGGRPSKTPASIAPVSEYREAIDRAQMQRRYPAERGGEEVYVLREHLSLAERKANIARLRSEAESKLRHARALEAETDELIQRGILRGAA